jgi:type IV pilus assembly protein PilM
MGAISANFAGSHGLSPEHAAQWLTHVGLEQPVEQIEGDAQIVADARAALEQGVGSLADDVRLSLEYYGAQEGAIPVERIVLCGPGSAVPGLALLMEARFSIPLSIARPAALAGFDDATAARLTVPFGLALED